MAGQRFAAGLGGFSIHDSVLPVRLRVSSPGYDAQELVVTESSGTFYPNFNTIEVRPQMRLTPLAGAQDVVGEAVNDRQSETQARATPFASGEPGCSACKRGGAWTTTMT